MMPVFIKFDEHDKITMSMGEVQDETVANWTEKRLLEFLDAYLRIDRGGVDFADEAVADPVCGMRISRSLAVASFDYLGHAYYFCSTECQEQFNREPTAYVRVKAM